MNRKSKIAKLPRHIRNQLNRDLDENKEGKALVAWLNSLPEVGAVLAEKFDGKVITEQNLSDWRKTGLPDWQTQQEKHDLVRQVLEEAKELPADTGGVELNHALAAILSAELAAAVREGLRDKDDPQKRWKLLVEALAQLARLRREDHKAARLAIEQERWDQEKQEADRQAESSRAFSTVSALAERAMVATLFSDPNPMSQAAGVTMAERLLAGQEGANGDAASKSRQIQANPG
jgi:hypothetical protein